MESVNIHDSKIISLKPALSRHNLMINIITMKKLITVRAMVVTVLLAGFAGCTAEPTDLSKNKIGRAHV